MKKNKCLSKEFQISVKINVKCLGKEELVLEVLHQKKESYQLFRLTINVCVCVSVYLYIYFQSIVLYIFTLHTVTSHFKIKKMMMYMSFVIAYLYEIYMLCFSFDFRKQSNIIVLNMCRQCPCIHKTTSMGFIASIRDIHTS